MRRSAPSPDRSGKVGDSDEIRTYGHIVVDEVQDLTPMQLRMVARRSLNGSLTVVGDLAQATGPWAPSDWSDVTRYLPDKGTRVVGLSVGYRIPSQIMQLADRVMHAATPGLRPPQAVRVGDSSPRVVAAASRDALGAAVAAATAAMLDDGRGAGAPSVAVIAADTMVDEVALALDAAGIPHGRATTAGLEGQVTVVPISVAKGLEIDGVVVVEPAQIVESEIQGLRALYVALTASHPAPHHRPRRGVAGTPRGGCVTNGAPPAADVARPLVDALLGGALPVRIELWDGSVDRAGGGVAGGRHAAHPLARRAAPDRVVPQRAGAGTGLRRR